MLKYLSATCAWAAVLASTAGADWPHLRGPNFDGVSPEQGLADSWPKEGPPVLWTRELGQGHSGLIVAGGRCFTQYQTSRGQFLLCLEPDTGATLWETRFDSGWHPRGAYPGPYATPTWAEGRVFCTSPGGRVACFDAGTGAVLWSLNIREQFQGRGYDFGYAATPLVENGRVILPAGGPEASLVALSVQGGHTLWASGGDPASYCSAFPVTIAGRRCIVGYLQNCFVLIDAADGRLLYRQAFSAGYDEHSAWPIYQEPDLLLASPFRQPANQWRIQIAANHETKLASRWVSSELSNDVVSSVLYRNHLFGFDIQQLQSSPHRPSRGTFRCLDWTTGKVCWSTDRVGQASVLAADDKLFLLSDTGNLILARASPSSYDELGRIALFEDEMCWTPPALSQGRLFVRSPSRAFCLFVGRPENLASNLSSGTLHHQARTWRFDVAWFLNRERDYPNDAPSLEEMNTWFKASLLCFAGAAVLAVGLGLLARCLIGIEGSILPLFLGLAAILSFAGPNLIGAWSDHCLFTWPAGLYALFHATALAYSRAASSSNERRWAWLARALLIGFLLAIWGYFEICKRTGMFVCWSFLLGFPLASPVTLLAIRWSRRQKAWAGMIGTVLGFSVFFWSAEIVFWWKGRLT